MPSRFKALSCEPAFSNLSLNLTGIDWVIMGGGSDALADPFHVEWALSLRKQCRQAGAAFFLKQLGRNAMFKGRALNLVDEHSGDWTEWRAAWKTRKIPNAFRAPGVFKLSPHGTLLRKIHTGHNRRSLGTSRDVRNSVACTIRLNWTARSRF